MKKPGSYRNNGQLWKKRALMEKTGTNAKAVMKHLKARFLNDRLTE